MPLLPHLQHQLIPCQLPAACSFSVYDAIASTPARYFLPARSASAISAIQEANASAVIPPPGTPERWQLPQDLSQMQATAVMFNRADEMANLFVSESPAACRDMP